MSILQNNQKFKVILWDMAERELAELPAKEDIEVTFSKRFIRRMNRILRADKYGYLRLVDARWKRTVAACVAICIMLSSAMSVKAIREPVIEFIENCYEKFTEFVFGEKQETEQDIPETIETVYVPAYIPEGYKQGSVDDFPQMIYTTWKNEDGNTINFRQVVAFSTNLVIDTETQNYKNILIDNLKVYYLIDGTNTYYQWIYNNYLFSLEFTGEISSEEAIQIISSISEKK